MRRSLAIGTILRSDDNVGSAVTQATLLHAGRWAEMRGVHLDFIPCMGAGKDLARAEVLAAYWRHSRCEDLLWIDHGNGIPADVAGGGSYFAAVRYLDALLCLDEPVVWGPYLVRGGERPAFACSLPDERPATEHVKIADVAIPSRLGAIDAAGVESAGIRLLKLGGCGFGWTRMRRDVVGEVFRAYADEDFLSNRLDSGVGELECVDVFSSLRRRRADDTERRDRPMRLEPEDDSFWHRMRERGLSFHPYAMVDYPIAHGRHVADFGAALRLNEAPPTKRSGLVGADGKALS